jgi:tRNA G37 N-methylase Trm5
MVTLSQNIAKKILKPGDSAVDATAGNGHDTLFLAELVGSSGRVYSFDIQSEAILNTKRLLLENNVFERVKLLQKGHEEIDSEVTKGIKVVMFNTGYLPGRHNEIITKEKTTLIALKKSLELISVGGLVLLVIYTGHKGGVKEAEAVEKYLNNLSYKHFDVVKINNLNRYNVPPYLICIQKISEKED